MKIYAQKMRGRAKFTSTLSLSLVAVGWLTAGAAFGAGAKVGKADAQQGLNGTTPTDDVGELGGGEASPPATGGQEFPAVEDRSVFDVEAGKGSVASSKKTAAGTAPSPASSAAPALRQGAPQAAANPALPVQPPAAPAAVPGPAPAAASATPAAAPAAAALEPTPASAPATGTESIAPPTPGPTQEPVQAPPLPPPNEFAGAPPVPGTMRLMAEGEAPEEYGVEAGDTLFDICDQLLDEAGYWPKLWALNPEIKNPHFIFPNMRLRFYPGDDDTPPYLQVVSEDDVIPIDKANLDEQQLVAEKVVFPADKLLQEEVREVVGPDQIESIQESVILGGKIYDATSIEVEVPAFIYSQERNAAGHVLIGRRGEEAAQLGEEVQIKADTGMAVGLHYTVLRRGEDVKNPETGDFVGYKYYYVASVRSVRQGPDGIFRTVVEDSRLSVNVDDIVVSHIQNRRTMPINEEVGSLRPTAAHIVGWDYDGVETGSRGNFALIDKGSGAGLMPGMYLPVYSTPGFLSLTTGDAELPEDYEMIGAMRIIDVTDAGACGYILQSTAEMRVGDLTNRGS